VFFTADIGCGNLLCITGIPKSKGISICQIGSNCNREVCWIASDVDVHPFLLQAKPLQIDRLYCKIIVYYTSLFNYKFNCI
jgi:hypothetical protein